MTNAFAAKSLIAAALLGMSAGQAWPQARETAGIELEAKIALGKVNGRIDHMAIDLARGRLFVAELGNDSVGVVDVKANNLLQRIAGLAEPQGVGYAPSTDTLYVANARGGSVRLYRGDGYTPAGAIELRDDADNIRVDPDRNRVMIGYGNGGIAAIEAASGRRIADITLKAHPESFQVARDGARIYVNLPGAQTIGVIDTAAGKQIATWPLPGMRGNFAMALDEEGQRVLVVFRNPAKLAAFAMADGALVTSVDTCGDVDDLFIDAKRQRIYVSCGEGFIDVLDKTNTPYRRIARMRTVAGARTSLFVPALDRLYVAVRASGSEPAAIWVWRPVP